jgi:hypothetical protein
MQDTFSVGTRHCHCGKRSSFGYRKHIALKCKEHKEPNMVSVCGSFCEEPACLKRSCFGEEGGKALFCKDHKHESHVDLKHKRCEFGGCTKRPNFGEKGGTERFCASHKPKSFVDVCSNPKKCQFEGCETRPSFGSQVELNAIYCSRHKRVNDVNISKRKSQSAHSVETISQEEALRQANLRRTKISKHSGPVDVTFTSKYIIPDDIVYRTCSQCKENFDNEEFFRGNTPDDGLFKHCKQCRESKPMQVDHAEHQQILRNKKQELGEKCGKCGESDLNLLELDHIDCTEKSMDIQHHASAEKLAAELNKVQLLCGFCHRLKTYGDMQIKKIVRDQSRVHLRRQYNIRQRNMAFVNQVKLEIGGCQECNRKVTSLDPALCSCFEFDHVDRTTKIDGISAMANGGRSIDVIKREIAKCRLLCVNCHKKHTRVQLGMKYYRTEC